jgi:hypothetical protein
MSNLVYTLVVSGERFDITTDQFATEPGNWLVAGLSGSKREVQIQAEPAIFKLIQAHLRGYDILPLSDGAVPYYLSKDVMMANLLKEAERYKLKRLSTIIKQNRNSNIIGSSDRSKKKKYKIAVSLLFFSTGLTANIAGYSLI